MKSILIVDDEKEICRSLKGVLSDEGYQVKTAFTPEAAWGYIESQQPHLILLDVWFGKGSWDGVHFLDRIKQNYPFIPVVMISGHATLSLAVRAIKKGATDFIEKPVDVDRLLISVDRALEMSSLKSQTAHEYTLSRQLIKEWPMEIDGRLKKAALGEHRLLLVGEDGLRKAHLAYALHNLSPRAQTNFVLFDAQHMNNMKPSQLWGQESQGRIEEMGLLDYAQGGTFLIHNIHHLTLPLQKQWARVFESNSFTRCAGVKPVPLNVRFIATSCPQFLNKEQKEGVDKEFYDRVTLFPHGIKPLREDRRALNAWISALLKEISMDLGSAVFSVTDSFSGALQGYNWPYNVRELRNVLEFAILQAKNEGEAETLGTQHLPHYFSGTQIAKSDVPGEIFSLPLKTARAVFELKYVNAQLALVDGNFTRAAEVIGMERSALHRKLKALQVVTKTVHTGEKG